jgi:P27 family predicted phage terminase small subunit
MTTRPPRAPAGLGRDGAALWRRMHKSYEVTARWELDLLELACRQADDVAALEAAITETGYMVKGSQGQPRLNPAVTEARLSRAALARMLGQIQLPSEAGGGIPTGTSETPASETAASRRGRKAAEKRWASVSHLAPAKEG